MSKLFGPNQLLFLGSGVFKDCLCLFPSARLDQSQIASIRFPKYSLTCGFEPGGGSESGLQLLVIKSPGQLETGEVRMVQLWFGEISNSSGLATWRGVRIVQLWFGEISNSSGLATWRGVRLVQLWFGEISNSSGLATWRDVQIVQLCFWRSL